MHSEAFNNKISSLDDMSKRLGYNYFTKQEAITKLYEIVMDKKPLLRGHFGNYNAKVAFVVNYDSTNDKVLELIKKFYTQNNANFYSLYITSIDKFGLRDLDVKVLNKELEIVKPSRVIVLGDKIELSQDMLSMCKDELDILLECVNNKESIPSYPNYQEIKEKFINCIKFALFG